MQFGSKTTDQPRNSESTTNNKFIKYFQKGETRMRFLQEMNPGEDEHGGWTWYYEHFHPGKSRTFPCTRDKRTCPGCTSDNAKMSSASKRYLVNALRPDEGYVDLYKIPVSIIDDLSRYADKDGGSITARDYTVVRYETSDGKTAYSVDREEKDKLDLSQWDDKHQDHQQALNDAYVEVWGELPGAEGQKTAGEENQDGGDVLDLRTHRRLRTTEEPAKTPEHLQDPPSEPAAESADSAQAEEEQVVTEEELRAMSAEEIKALFTQCSLEVPDSDDVNVLVEKLKDALGE